MPACYAQAAGRESHTPLREGGQLLHNAPPMDRSAAAPTTCLEFTGIRRAFGRLRVLGGVNGRLTSGEVLAITGHNGSGKSTLLKCLAGLLAPDAGSVRYREGERELDVAARRRAVGFLSPDLAFYEELTVAENLEFFCRLRSLPVARADELRRRVDLPADRRSGALSSGMRQRLRWAFALLHAPRLLLLDEPLEHFDAAGTALAGELLAEHLAGGGLAVVANPSRLELPGVASRIELGR